ncbi:pyridoxal phosphate-dependent aminotransferase [Bacillus sp. JJ722]|uniref:pyridoxal phosphate-dependent aminotransferase n=1 Tax=Bacillus sp. JJ722 TaxID=3122973 RepID=UPI002FFED266
MRGKCKLSLISKTIEANLEQGSWIRDLFEKGNQLRSIHGNDKVYDFSLGNPIVEPPSKFRENIKVLAQSTSANLHGYISNQGLIEAREKVAQFLQSFYKKSFSANSIIMTVGAGGALNVALNSIVNPGDEVIILVPYFVEYKYYIENVQGTPVFCNLDENFQINIEQLADKVTDKTKAIIVNTPHNPTGTILSDESIKALGKLLKDREQQYGTSIYLVYDAPYTQLTYDGIENDSPFDAYHRVIYASSFSKDLGIAGERIGYIAIDDAIEGHDLIMAALVFSNRTLGFVNAPAFMQRVLAMTDDLVTEQQEYKQRRDLVVDILKDAKFDFITPQGGFFVFPKSPIADDVEFCKFAAENYNILVVPGTGFGCPGYFRMSFSVDIDVLERSREAFKELNSQFVK